jgi:hypothetical protein
MRRNRLIYFVAVINDVQSFVSSNNHLIGLALVSMEDGGYTAHALQHV